MNPLFRHLEPCAQVRWGDRTDLDLTVALKLEAGPSAPGHLRNISVSGALIATSALPPVRTSLRVVLDVLIDGRPVHLELDGRVIRHCEAAIGIEWRDMACQQVRELMQRLRPAART